MFFNIVKDLFKSIEGLRRSGKLLIGSEANEFIVQGVEIEVLNTLSDLALKLLTLYNLTKYFFAKKLLGT